MLTYGPQHSFPMPSSPVAGSRDLGRQILKTIQSSINASTEVSVGMVSTGCDGLQTVNPLNGTTCNGALPNNGSACSLVLYNPARRGVLSHDVGRALSSSLASCAPGVTALSIAPSKFVTLGSCDAKVAAMRKRRRFIDNLGNVYGPDGAYVSSDAVPAQLETDYIQELRMEHVFDVAWDPPVYFRFSQVTPRKMTSPIASGGGIQGTVWPSIDDVISSQVFPALQGVEPFTTTTPYSAVTGLNDATFSGAFSGTSAKLFIVTIDGTSTPNTFKLQVLYGPSDVPGIPIAGGDQALAYGINVRFESTTGHTMGNYWVVTAAPNNDIIRLGVAVRGTITEAKDCVNGGFPNNRVLVTTELATTQSVYDAGTTFAGRELHISEPIAAGSHALVVRDADTLTLKYRKTLDHDGTGYAWGDPPQKFCFSTNDEGLFAMHCYTVPNLVSPPTPYPGHEFGSPDSRKIAIISVNPLTFEPTITEVITLESSSRTAESRFAVMITVP